MRSRRGSRLNLLTAEVNSLGGGMAFQAMNHGLEALAALGVWIPAFGTFAGMTTGVEHPQFKG